MRRADRARGQEPPHARPKVALLDVNLLIALAWPNHIHHTAAHAWFHTNQPHGWATCPLTQAGFVRISSNQRVIPGARSPAEACRVLERIVALPHHRFWTDDVSMVASPEVPRQRLVGHRQVTDAHLLALAIRNGGRLATLDRAVHSLLDGPIGAGAVAIVA